MAALLLADPNNNRSRSPSSSFRMTNKVTNNSNNNPVTMMRVRTGELLERNTMDDDDSTIGTTATNKQQQQQHLYDEEQEGLEIAEIMTMSSHDRNTTNNSRLPCEAPPPRPLSPVLSSSNSPMEDRGSDDSWTEPPLSSSASASAIPSAIPPRPTPHCRRPQDVMHTMDVSVASATPNNTPVKSSSSSSSTSRHGTKQQQQQQQSSLLRGLWQRCSACYCIPNNSGVKGSSDNSTVVMVDRDTNNTNNKNDLDEPSEYFSSFLPQLLLDLDDTDDACLHDLVPKLCAQLQQPAHEFSQKVRRNALEELAQLCDRDHAHHRIPLVCCSTYRALEEDDDTDNVEVPLESREEETPNDIIATEEQIIKTVSVMESLCHVLQDPTLPLKDYRQALLILSNLTLPLENKAVLLLGPQKDILLQTLWDGLNSAATVVGMAGDPTSYVTNNNNANKKQSQRTSITTLAHKTSSNMTQSTTTTTNEQQRTLEVHLILAILYNLSFLYDGIPVLAEYVPPSLLYITETDILPLDHPDSLLRVLERMLVSFQPLVAPQIVDCDDDKAMAKYQNGGSVERQCMRWAFGVIRNLCVSTNTTTATTNSHNGATTTTTTTTTEATTTAAAAAAEATSNKIVQWIGATQIPLVALQVLRYTPTSDNYQGQWRPQSLEDLALGLWVELALREEEYSISTTTTTVDKLNGIQPKLCPALYNIRCQDYLQPLIHANAGGIHSVRARAIVKRFDGVDLLAPMVHESRRRRSSIINDSAAAWPAAASTPTSKSSGTSKRNQIQTKEDGYQYYCDDDTHNDTSTMVSV